MKNYEKYDNINDMLSAYVKETNNDDLSVAKLQKWLNATSDVLSAKEKKYLNDIVKPLNLHNVLVRKRDVGVYLPSRRHFQAIDIYGVTKDAISSRIELPPFISGTMYKGMELDKQYTVAELGL